MLKKTLTIIILVLLLFLSVTSKSKAQLPHQAPQSDPENWSHFTLYSIVRSVAIDGQVLWVGTANGLLRYDLAHDKQTVYTTKDGLLSNIIHNITISPKGEPWVGTIGGGLSHFNGQQWKTYTPYGAGSPLQYDDQNWQRYAPGTGLGDLWVYGMHFDPKGVLWVATWKGVSVFNGKTFKTYTTDDGLIDKWVYTLSQDQDGVFWFGTEGGVSRFDGTNWKSWDNKNGVGATVKPRSPHMAQSLPFTPRHHEGEDKPLSYNPNYVVSSTIDKQNRLWIGTLGGGLSVFDGKTWKSYSKQDGLSGNMVHALAFDKKGILWIGTDGGVSRFDGQDFRNLGKTDGVGAVFSIAMADDGSKWFGTFGGVSQYRGE